MSSPVKTPLNPRIPISWEDFFGAIVAVCGQKSKDPHTQVGAIIVNDLKQIIATGYNGFPRGLSDSLYPWNRTGKEHNIKYTYVVHAELNAIISARTNISGMSLYTSLFPCANCAKIIIQSQIKEVIYMQNFYADTDNHKSAVRMLRDAKINCIQIKPIHVTISSLEK